MNERLSSWGHRKLDLPTKLLYPIGIRDTVVDLSEGIFSFFNSTWKGQTGNILAHLYTNTEEGDSHDYFKPLDAWSNSRLL